MNDSQQPTASGEKIEHATILWFRQRLPSLATVREFIVLFAVTGFLLLYGLVPVFAELARQLPAFRSPATQGAALKVLGDAMEAIMAAVYLDGGLEAARTLFTTAWAEELARTDNASERDDV